MHDAPCSEIVPESAKRRSTLKSNFYLLIFLFKGIVPEIFVQCKSSKSGKLKVLCNAKGSQHVIEGKVRKF